MPGVNPDSGTLNELIRHAREDLDLPENVRELLRWCGLELRRLSRRAEALEDGLTGEIERLEAILAERAVEAEDDPS